MKELILLTCLLYFLPDTANAQWEKIAWDSRPAAIEAKVGANVFFQYNKNIFRSTDEGKSWEGISNGIPDGYHAAYCDWLLTDDQYIYQYPSYGWKDFDRYISEKFYRLKWNDTIWEQFEIFKPDSAGLRGIISLTEDSLLLVFQYPFPNYHDSVYLSYDHGKTWHSLNLILPPNISNSSFPRKIEGEIVATTYSGIAVLDREKWKWNIYRPNIPDSITLSITHPSPNLFFAIPSEMDTAYPYERINKGLYRSTDLGVSWQTMDTTNLSQINAPIFYVYDFDSLLLGRDYKASGPLKIRYYISSDRGAHWFPTVLPDSFPISIGGIFQFPDGMIVGDYANQFKVSKDLLNWQPYPVGNIPSGFKDISLVSGSTLFAHPPENPYSTQRFLSDTIYISRDDGSTWESYYFGNYGLIDLRSWCESNGSIYAGGMNKDSIVCIFKSSDLGKTWNVISTFSVRNPLIDYVSSIGANAETILVTLSPGGVLYQYEGLFLSIDGGTTWVDLTKTLPEYSPLYGIPPHLYNGNIYATVSIYPLGIAFAHTSINPIQWIVDTIDRHPSFQINQLETLGNQIFIGTTLNYNTQDNIYVSGDEGNTWEISDYGVDRNCTLELSLVHDSIIYFSGYYTGDVPEMDGYGRIFYSKNHGLNWNKLPSTFTSGRVYIGSKYIFFNSDALYRLPFSALKPESVPFISNLSIEAVYPSPANYVSYIRFVIPESSVTELDVYDISGRKITTLINKTYDRSEHEITWDTKRILTGTYLLTLKSNGKVASRTVQVVH